MLILTTTVAQTVKPGQPIIFDKVLFQTGKAECWRNANGRIPTTFAQMRNAGVYAPTFQGNIGSVAVGNAQINIQLDGFSLPETLTIVPTATAGNLTHVSTTTRLINDSSSNNDKISVVNTGSADITIGANASLLLERRG